MKAPWDCGVPVAKRGAWLRDDRAPARRAVGTPWVPHLPNVGEPSRPLHGKRSPCSAPGEDTWGAHGSVPLCPQPQDSNSWPLARTNSENPRVVGIVRGRKEGGHGATVSHSCPGESCREPWGQARPQGVTHPLDPPESPVGVSPSSYLLPLRTSPQLDEPSQEKGQNPAAGGAAPHGWARGAGCRHPLTARASGGDKRRCRLLSPPSPAAEK